MPTQKVPARYVGTESRLLSAAYGPFEDATGRRLDTTELHPGDTLMVWPHEVYGETRKWDPAGVRPLLGTLGRAVLPEHDGASEEELGALGYEFIAPSPHWEPLLPFADYQQRLRGEGAAPAAAQEPAPALAEAAANEPTVDEFLAVAQPDREPEPEAEAAPAPEPEPDAGDPAAEKRSRSK